MVTVTSSNSKAMRTARTYRPYGSMRDAAAALGVTRQHLHCVLTGERRSPRIERHPLFRRLIKANRAKARKGEGR